MTNIFEENTTYLTTSEYSDSWWMISSEAEIKIYIRKAEIVIDNIIWSYWTKENSNQNTIFPVLWEGVPLDIKKACFLITDCLYKNRNNNWSKVILSETRRGNSVTYDTRFQDKYKNIHFCYNEEIYSYLKAYVKNDKTKTNSFFRT